MSTPKQRRAESLAFWLNQRNGAIRDSATIESIRAHSECLETLYKKGIDITGIYKFSPEEERLAQLIGEVFFNDYEIVESIKRIICEDKFIGKIRLRAEMFGKTMRLLKELVKLDIIEDDFAYERYVTKRNETRIELLPSQKKYDKSLGINRGNTFL